MEESDIPELDVSELSPDQEAVLALYGQPVVGWSGIALFYDPTKPESKFIGRHVRRWRCPVIEWRGKRWSIWPTGAVIPEGPPDD